MKNKVIVVALLAALCLPLSGCNLRLLGNWVYQISETGYSYTEQFSFKMKTIEITKSTQYGSYSVQLKYRGTYTTNTSANPNEIDITITEASTDGSWQTLSEPIVREGLFKFESGKMYLTVDSSRPSNFDYALAYERD